MTGSWTPRGRGSAYVGFEFLNFDAFMYYALYDYICYYFSLIIIITFNIVAVEISNMAAAILVPAAPQYIFKKGEIVGVNQITNGRTCDLHPNGCGLQLLANDVVRFVDEITKVDGKDEAAIRVFIMKEGMQKCCVGFLPRFIVLRLNGQLNMRHARILRLYADSMNETERKKSYENYGIAAYELL